MAKASQATEPSMEEILASIRRIISDEVAPAPAAAPSPVASTRPAPVAPGATVTEDDLDRLFDDAKIAAPQEDDMAEMDQSAVDDMFASPAAVDAFEDEPVVEDEEEPIDLDASMEIEDDGADMDANMDLIEGMPEETDVAFFDPSPSAEPDFDAFAAAVEPAPLTPPEPPKPAPPRVDARPAMNAQSRPVAASPLMSAEAGGHVAAAFGSLANTVFSGNARTMEDLVQEMLRPMLKEWLDDNLPAMVERLVRAEIERVSRGGR